MINDVFKVKGFSAGRLIKGADNAEKAMSDLPPFLRTLLVTDGTVTKSLEAFFWEDVNVALRDQKPLRLEQDLPHLNLSSGDTVIERNVYLQGIQSQDIYCYATSYIRLEGLRQDLRSSLAKGEMGIGELLREVGLESYRDIVQLEHHFYNQPLTGDSAVETIARTYVINIDHQPVMQITERFPLVVFDRKR